jgi:type I restriction enzyme S subunit
MDFDSAHFAKYALRPGDILVSEGQSPELVGQSAIYRGGIEGLCFQKTLHRFRSRTDLVLPEFAQIVFRAFVKAGVFMRFASLTVNIAHLTLERFTAIPFPLPPLDEQARIVERITRQLDELRAVRRDIDSQITRAARLRQSILMAAFEGRLVPQDPTDEPAANLLDRIRGERATTGSTSRARANTKSARRTSHR